MKRLMLFGVLVASCSFVFVSWLTKMPEPQNWEGIVITPEQEKWLAQKFQAEEKVNALKKKVILLQEQHERIKNERRTIAHWSAVDARIIIQEIESSKKFAFTKQCTEPNENLKDYCTAYEQAKADREWWNRLTLVAVQLNAAQHELLQAEIQAGAVGNDIPEVQRKLMKYFGTA